MRFIINGQWHNKWTFYIIYVVTHTTVFDDFFLHEKYTLYLNYGKCSKISITSSLQKRPRQTVQTLEQQCRHRSDCFWRSSLIRVFPVCYSEKHFVNSSPENQHFNWERKEKSVKNFRTFTVTGTLYLPNSYSSNIFCLENVLCLSVWFDSTCSSQQFFSHVRMGLPGLNKY